MNFSDPAWRRSPIKTAGLVAMSLVRQRVPTLRRPTVRYAGDLSIRADLSTALGLRLYRYGFYDDDLDFVRRYLKPGDTFIDGGANIGLYTLVAFKAVGALGSVYAFEPAPATADTLRQNIAQNNAAGSVHVIEAALATSDGEADFIQLHGDAAGLSSFYPPLAGKQVKVKTVALDSVIDRERWADIALIKLDVEGAEVAAVTGAVGILSTNQAALLVELVDENLRRQGHSAVELVGLLRSFGYQFFRPLGEGFVRPVSDPLMNDSPNLVAATSFAQLALRGLRYRA